MKMEHWMRDSNVSCMTNMPASMAYQFPLSPAASTTSPLLWMDFCRHFVDSINVYSTYSILLSHAQLAHVHREILLLLGKGTQSHSHIAINTHTLTLQWIVCRTQNIKHRRVWYVRIVLYGIISYSHCRLNGSASHICTYWIEWSKANHTTTRVDGISRNVCRWIEYVLELE